MSKSGLFARRTKTKVLILVGFILVIGGLVSVALLFYKPVNEVQVGTGNFSLWLADSERERVKGLSDVRAIDENGGLLMVFPSSARYGIWMKDMNFPIDVVWLDSDRKVVHITENLPPEEPAETVYKPDVETRYILELSAGSVQRAGIKIGDTAMLNINV